MCRENWHGTSDSDAQMKYVLSTLLSGVSPVTEHGEPLTEWDINILLQSCQKEIKIVWHHKYCGVEH